MSMFNDVSWGSKDNEKECESNARLVSLYAKRFGAGQWSFLGPGSEKKWYSISEDSSQGRMGQNGGKDDGDTRRKRTPSLPCHESIVQRSAKKQKAMENCRFTIMPIRQRLKLFFALLFLQISSVFKKAVVDMCEEYETFQDRTGQPVVGGKSSSSFVPSVITTEVPLDRDDHAHKDLPLQQYR